jgi:hypothetical protein
LRSLRMRLFGLWLLSLAAGVAIAVVLLQPYQQSAEAQVARAQAAVAHTCEFIKRYGQRPNADGEVTARA